jgi:lipopolysaccharide transport system permease protein
MKQEEWTLVIKPQARWFELNLKEIWRARDLLWVLVWRDFVAVYKQTILGPLWYFIQPLLSTVIFTVIFGKIAKIPTDGIPHILFYMAGITAWNYFADCLNKTSNTFISNAGIFGKVYFPRMVVPLSMVISNLIKFFIQFLLFIFFVFFFYFRGAAIHFNGYILLTPILILLMAGLGLGFGIIVSSLTTKYRDLQHLVSFGVQLLMYLTPVVYPVSYIPEKYKWLILANPMTSVIETFKFAFLGAGTFNFLHLLYSSFFTLIILVFGIMIFNKVEKTFMDTV